MKTSFTGMLLSAVFYYCCIQPSEAAAVTMTSLTVVVRASDNGVLPNLTLSWINLPEYGLNETPEWIALPLAPQTQCELLTTVGASLIFKATADGYANSYHEVTAAGRQLHAPVVVTLAHGAQVHGTLSHTKGLTVTTGVVEAVYTRVNDETPYGRMGNLIDVYSDTLTTSPITAKGTFHFNHLPQGTVRLKISSPGFEMEDLQQHFGSPVEGSTTVTVPMLSTGYVAGILESRDDTRTSGVLMLLAKQEDWRYGQRHTETDSQGRFRFEDVPDRPYIVMIESNGDDYRSVVHEGDQLNVEDLRLVVFPEQPPNPRANLGQALVIDRVTDRPLREFRAFVIPETYPHAEVFVDYNTSQTGVFHIHSSQHFGSQSMLVQAPGYAPLLQQVSTGSHPEQYSMGKASRLTGNVVDAVTSEGVENAILRTEWEEYDAFSGHNGAFAFPVFPAGDTTLKVMPPETYRRREADVQVSQEMPGTTMSIAVEKAALLRGRLVQVPGSVPIAGQHITFGRKVIRTEDRLSEEAVEKETRTDADGRFHFYDSGKAIHVGLQDYHLDISFPHSLESGEERELVIGLSSAEVILESGAGAMAYYYGTCTRSGISYELCSTNHRSDYLLATDSHGRAVIRDLPPGEWELFLFTKPGWRQKQSPMRRRITVPETGSLTVNFESKE